VFNFKITFFLPPLLHLILCCRQPAEYRVQKLCEISVSICYGDGFDASNCTDFDSYSLCCLPKSWLWIQSKILYMLAQKRARIMICLILLYCIRVANTLVLQKLTAHEQDHTFYNKAIDLHT
jgi:hypothetical protein